MSGFEHLRERVSRSATEAQNVADSLCRSSSAFEALRDHLATAVEVARTLAVTRARLARDVEEYLEGLHQAVERGGDQLLAAQRKGLRWFLWQPWAAREAADAADRGLSHAMSELPRVAVLGPSLLMRLGRPADSNSSSATTPHDQVARFHSFVASHLQWALPAPRGLQQLAERLARLQGNAPPRGLEQCQQLLREEAAWVVQHQGAAQGQDAQHMRTFLQLMRLWELVEEEAPGAEAAPAALNLPEDVEPLLCPITQAVMVDPVRTDSRWAYERSAIELMFKDMQRRHQPLICPFSGNQLSSDRLSPDPALARQVLNAEAEVVRGGVAVLLRAASAEAGATDPQAATVLLFMESLCRRAEVHGPGAGLLLLDTDGLGVLLLRLLPSEMVREKELRRAALLAVLEVVAARPVSRSGLGALDAPLLGPLLECLADERHAAAGLRVLRSLAGTPALATSLATDSGALLLLAMHASSRELPLRDQARHVLTEMLRTRRERPLSTRRGGAGAGTGTGAALSPPGAAHHWWVMPVVNALSQGGLQQLPLVHLLGSVYLGEAGAHAFVRGGGVTTVLKLLGGQGRTAAQQTAVLRALLCVAETGTRGAHDHLLADTAALAALLRMLGPHMERGVQALALALLAAAAAPTRSARPLLRALEAEAGRAPPEAVEWLLANTRGQDQRAQDHLVCVLQWLAAEEDLAAATGALSRLAVRSLDARHPGEGSDPVLGPPSTSPALILLETLSVGGAGAVLDALVAADGVQYMEWLLSSHSKLQAKAALVAELAERCGSQLALHVVAVQLLPDLLPLAEAELGSSDSRPEALRFAAAVVALLSRVAAPLPRGLLAGDEAGRAALEEETLRSLQGTSAVDVAVRMLAQGGAPPAAHAAAAAALRQLAARSWQLVSGAHAETARRGRAIGWPLRRTASIQCPIHGGTTCTPASTLCLWDRGILALAQSLHSGNDSPEAADVVVAAAEALLFCLSGPGAGAGEGEAARAHAQPTHVAVPDIVRTKVAAALAQAPRASDQHRVLTKLQTSLAG